MNNPSPSRPPRPSRQGASGESYESRKPHRTGKSGAPAKPSKAPRQHRARRPKAERPGLGSPSAARLCALNILSYVRTHEAYARDVFNSDKRVQELSPEDRAFCAKLVLGVVSTYGVLDLLLDEHFARPEEVSTALRDALRIPVYELVFLKKEPHASVSQGVELARHVAPRAAGMANAVLRKVAAQVDEFPFGDPHTNDKALARLHGFPYELTDRLIDEIGRTRAMKLLEAQDSPAPLFVTSIPTVTPDDQVGELLQEHGILASPVGPVPGAWLIHDTAKFLNSGLIDSHGLIPMDYSAQIVAALAAGEGKDPMLEVGSGRGTKSAVIASHILRHGQVPRIMALDLYAYKAKLAADRLDSLRISGVTQVTADATSHDALSQLERYKTIFLDAPCSGTGTLRRNPELVWSTTPEKVESLANLQLKMLRTLAPHVEYHGALIYATCSVLRAENEDVIKAFLESKEGRDFKLVPVYERYGLSKEEAEQLRYHCTSEGYFRTFPAEGGADGHFCAPLVRIKELH